MPRISTKNQVTIPVNVLQEADLHPGDQVVIETLDTGDANGLPDWWELKYFGVLTGTYPPGFLQNLDLEDEQR